MWSEKQQILLDDLDDSDSDSSEEIPVWVRGEQRWVSGIVSDTTCQDVVQVLLQDEEAKGKYVGSSNQYQITERWRGVEQPLDPTSSILDIWNAWGSAQSEIKLSLRRIKNDRSRRSRYKSDSSTWSDRSAWKTIHPNRLQALGNDKQTSNTEELLKLVLAQGEVIRKQLRKLRHSEHQIGCLEDKTHRARVRKHGSNYLLETYLKGLSEALDPEQEEERTTTDKHSDSGVVTEGDSEQSNANKPSKSETSFERFSPSSDEFGKDIKDDDTSSTLSESTIKEQIELIKKISKLNKSLLKQEECLIRLDANLKKYEKYKNDNEDLTKNLNVLRTEMTKSSCEMQHNEIVLEETNELLGHRRQILDNLHRDLVQEEHEHEMLRTLLYTTHHNKPNRDQYPNYNKYKTKELLDTLV